MKRAVSVSLGSSKRNKQVIIEFEGVPIQVERIGTDGDADKARRLFAELDGQVDALGVGGVELYLRVDGREYPLRSGLGLVRDVKQTPVVDGRGLKHTLERRVFQLAAEQLGGVPHYGRAFFTLGVDRFGMAQAVSEVADEVIFGDLMFALGIPIPVKGLTNLRRLARILLPFVANLPISMVYPTGEKQETIEPKFETYWAQADLIAGDFLYIRKHMPEDLTGKDILTNTTTEADVALLKERGVRWLITTTPRYEGRSFGTNMMEAALTAFAGKGRALTEDELNELIDRLGIRPHVQRLNP
ncbi:MAG TPA: quinate 5-dehydrogenase [Anaerolineae bacterium]|nr:quinate 5-dehydrogenase [Anaerolineae bacterium]